MRLDRPIGTFLLLWPTLWALWVAGNGHPSARIVLIFSLGVVVMRSAGCVINDYADRNIDGKVARTRNRPLATNELSVNNALILFVALLLIALVLVLQLNRASLYFAILALAVATLYPFTKRFTHFPQLALAVAFSMAIPMAFIAQNQTLGLKAGLLWLANMVWVIAYDTIYAMVDREDDLKAKIKSSAILFGRFDRYIVFGLGVLAVAILVCLGVVLSYSGYYYLGLSLALANIIYQQWLLRNNATQFQAFISNHWFGAFVFIGILLHYLA